MVNHLVEGNLVFTALLEGVLPPERGLDRLGGDPVAAYRASAAALQAAGSHRRCRTAPIGRGRIGIAVPLPRRGPIPSRWGGIEPRRYLQRGDLVRQT
jgi:hypothetical protein